jgi:hypothetical protein
MLRIYQFNVKQKADFILNKTLPSSLMKALQTNTEIHLVADWNIGK